MANNLWTPVTNWNAGTDFSEAKAEAELTDNLHTLWLAMTGDLSGSGAGKVPHLHLTGTLGARPAAGNAGRFYRTTDNPKRIYFDDGANWVIVGGDDSLAQVTRNVNQTIPDAAQTDIIFTSARYDNDAMWNAGSPTQLTLNTAGVYDFLFLATWDPVAGGDRRQIWVLLNGVTNIGPVSVEPAGAMGPSQAAPARWKCAAGDKVTARVIQNSGGPLDIVSAASYSPEFSAKRIGTG